MMRKEEGRRNEEGRCKREGKEGGGKGGRESSKSVGVRKEMLRSHDQQQ